MDRLPAIGVVGYSLGGNLALKLTGEYGREAPAQVVATCAVSPTLDLASCIDALERRSNALYQWNFVHNLKARMRRKQHYWPGRFDLSHLSRIRSVRQFDEASRNMLKSLWATQTPTRAYRLSEQMRTGEWR